ncbi:hypothetical protein BGW36DRAFT_287970 [Talaromyces proteolyticus]|uniref:Initiation-specific alpha-1,6-mannosyltransferase n=1 Tax=Talaromyces proteolyticus TaxID=1131652 RepID=A0AAD4KZL8_9EURO|nr:uncharacterized protein BGW36DRAFT_287970 [Talaromyces proteolyticus]KAH8703538.1 hypothetical protein BGW36DRAFT_287970 [Talaromyces proteolyticus]
MFSKRLLHSLLTPRRLSLWLLVTGTLFIFYRLSIARGAQDPDDATPRFLYRSPFRDDPDFAYEKSLSLALQGIEQTVLSENDGNNLAENIIWQIAKDDEHRGSDSLSLEQENKGWKYSVMTDDKAMEFVTKVLSAVPDIAEAYTSYPYYVLRTDLLRYLLIWYYGGFYADMDVYPARPINSCPDLLPILADDGLTKSNISLVVGVELDEPFATPRIMRMWKWTRRYGFMQYTMYAPRRFSPIVREIITRSIAHTKQHNERHKSILFGRPRYSQDTILGVTGPDVVTDAVLDVLSATLPPTHNLVNISMESNTGIDGLTSETTGEIERRVTWAPFHRLRHSLCVDGREATVETSMGGLCVLPVNAWGNGQRHSGSEPFNSPHACINHRFGGSWKKGWWRRIFG